MPTPLEFMQRYQALSVNWVEESAALRVCRPVVFRVVLRKYFMMSWKEGTEQLRDYQAVTRPVPGKKTGTIQQWFAANREHVNNAAMGKGSPRDYELALEWALLSGRIPTPRPDTVQRYCDEHLGIDCSGFATNYLIAAGKRAYSAAAVSNSSAASYYNAAHAVNDVTTIRQGDLLVWMNGNVPKSSNPAGHVAVVQSMAPESRAASAQGNLHVVESKGSSGLIHSHYHVEQVINRNDPVLKNPVMILKVKRHGVSGDRVSVMRPN